MKHLQLIFLVILIISFPISVQADFLKKVTKTTKNAGNEIVEVVEPTFEKTTNGVVNTSVNVFDWVETTGDSVISYEKVLAEAWKTGWRHSGSLDYTGPLSPAALSGHFSIMTYNIDGFPQVIGGNSSEDTRSISAILESMSLDIVVFQEDFTKHDELLSSLTTSTYPFRSNHWRGTETTFGDGLATISKFPFNFRDYRKVQWNECAGTLWEKFLGTSSHPDCMTEKGFSVVTLDIDEGLQIDFYNLHQDAGGDSESLASKQINMAQLAEYINTHSADKVVIVAGDFNMELGAFTSAIELTHLSTWIEFLNNTGLSVMCMEVFNNWNECDAAGFDKPDHILFKSNNEYTLYATAIEHAAELGEINKIDPENGLSDHYPLKGTFYWEKN